MNAEKMMLPDLDDYVSVYPVLKVVSKFRSGDKIRLTVEDGKGEQMILPIEWCEVFHDDIKGGE